MKDYCYENKFDYNMCNYNEELFVLSTSGNVLSGSIITDLTLESSFMEYTLSIPSNHSLFSSCPSSNRNDTSKGIEREPQFVKITSSLTIRSSDLYSVEEAIKRIKNIFGSFQEWTNFINIIPKLKANMIINKSAVSSNFVASLELVKNGYIEVKQIETFGNIFIRSK